MKNQPSNNVDDVLAALDLPQEERAADGQVFYEVHAEEEGPQESTWERPTIHVYFAEDDEALPEMAATPAVEGTLEDTQDDETLHDPDVPVRPRRSSMHTTLFVFSLIAFLGILAGITWEVVIPLFTTTTATVTIMAVREPITTTSTLMVVTGTPDATQVPGRMLTPETVTQQQTMPTTRTEHQEARAAHGWITFYNALPAAQTVTAGTLLMGTDGVQVVTEEDAVIPAGSFSTNGQVSVPAHAVLTGPAGNIVAGDIAGSCCRVNVLAQNTGAFVGGQDARDFSVVSQQDVDTVASTLKATLEQRAHMALMTQIRTGEALIAPNACTTQVKTDHAIGTEATQVQVTVQETCRGEVYTTQVLHALVEQAMQQRAGVSMTISAVSEQIVESTVVNEPQGTLRVQVKGSGIAMAQFTAEQRQEITILIAGQSEQEARGQIKQLAGVRSVSIQIVGRDTRRMPDDPEQIAVVVIYGM